MELLSAPGIPAPSGERPEMASGTGSPAYKTAWLNYTRGAPLTDEQTSILQSVGRTNATTGDGLFVPTTISDEIISLMIEQHPIIGDVKNLRVKGNFTINIHTGIVSGDADVIPVGTCLTGEQNTFVSVTLGGFQYGKLVEIPYAMRAMSIDAYESYLRSEIAARLGHAVARDIVYGNGTDRITGIVPKLLAESGTPQVVPYTEGSLSYDDIVAAMAASSKPAGTRNIYVNEETFWRELMTIKDTIGRPIFINDPATGRINSTFGVAVKIESAMQENDILAGKPDVGYVLNWNQEITVGAQDNLRCLRTDVVGWALVDGAPTTTKAWALLRPTPTP